MKLMHGDRQGLLEELKKTLIFQTLAPDELKRIAASGELLCYAPGETVVTQDSVSRYLYVLLRGSVDIMVKGKEKDLVFVSAVSTGDVFGEASIFLDVRRTASAVAKDEIRIFSLSRDAIFEYCAAEPRAGLKIFTFVIYSLLRKLSVVNKDLALERESMVTQEDIDALNHLFPQTIEDIFSKKRR